MSRVKELFTAVQTRAPGLLSVSFRRGRVPVQQVTRRYTTEAVKETATRKQSYKEYFLSTHFWGPAANWGFVAAGIADASKPASQISGWMTSALCVYSMLFMRFAWMVKPRNMLLFACHASNECVQLFLLGKKASAEMSGKE